MEWLELFEICSQERRPENRERWCGATKQLSITEFVSTRNTVLGGGRV